jgi:hypothetical protein
MWLDCAASFLSEILDCVYSDKVLWQVQHALTQWSPWLGSPNTSAQWWSATVPRDPASQTAKSTLTSSGPLERILSTGQCNWSYVQMMILYSAWNLIFLIFVDFAPYWLLWTASLYKMWTWTPKQYRYRFFLYIILTLFNKAEAQNDSEPYGSPGTHRGHVRYISYKAKYLQALKIYRMQYWH